MSYELRVNPIACDGHGMCAELLPELIELDPWGYPILASAAVLTSIGGTVVAGCQGAGAYLVSWSPAQEYGVDQVVRGPATTAQVTFTGSRKLVTMDISCSGGAPSASTTVRNWRDE